MDLLSCRLRIVTALLGLSCGLAGVDAATPSASDALDLKPIQGEVPFDQPAKGEIEKCSIKAEKVSGSTAWVVRGPAGTILRQFADSNSDNVVDTWSYFQNGLETYRDVDANFNGKADQYRWFQTAGSRWGIDTNEDGRIDEWRAISPEEAAEEVVAAIRTRDPARFARLLLTEKDQENVGLTTDLAKSIAKRRDAAEGVFRKLVSSGKVGKNAEFSDFGGIRPGLMPAGARGLKKDVLVYENAWAMVQDGEDHHQLQLGALLRIGDAWKLVDGPRLGSEEFAGGFIYTDPSGDVPSGPLPTAPNGEMQEILAEIEKVDQRIAAASSGDKPALNARRADLLERLADAAPVGAERDQWYEQMADMVSAAVQDGSYPDGAKRLAEVEKRLARKRASTDVLTHLKFRRMQAENSLELADPKADYAKIQAAWHKQLEGFVEAHGDSKHAAEALLQLAMASEFSRDEEAAEKWYRRVVEDFPDSPSAAKAKGAVVRLTSEGERIALAGNSVKGGKVDLREYRGKPVVVQYWISSYASCKAEHAVLKDLYKKYGGKQFEVLGVNLDYTRDELLGYLEENPLPWRQIHEQGGFDSRPANELGVVILPLMMLIDDQGVVVSRSVAAESLEGQLKKLFQSESVGSARASRGSAKR